MIKMKKRIILPTILLAGALAVGTIGLSSVSAQDSSSYPPIVQKLAERFGLSQTDVQEVFDEARADHHAQMLTNFEDRLDQAVSDGKITEDQKQLILDKHEEIQAKMDELQSLDPEAKREQMQAYHEELQNWAEDNNIDLPLFGFGPGFARGFKMGHQMGMMQGR